MVVGLAKNDGQRLLDFFQILTIMYTRDSRYPISQICEHTC